MAKFLAIALLALALSAPLSRAERSKGRHGTETTTEYPTLSPPPPDPDPLVHNLQFSLPIVTVCILLLIIMVITIVVMRKARYGQFCCLKPKMRFRYSDEGEVESGGAGGHASPPTYKVMEIIPPPPDYTDAVHDVLVSQTKPVPQEEDSAMTEVPLEENEREDDCAPLDP